MYYPIAIKKYGGNVAKDTNGKQELQIETKAEVALFVKKQKTGDIKMWWSISGIVLVIIGISLAFGGTYLSLWNIINIDLKKAGTWKELYERGEQAKKEKSKACSALRYILIGSTIQIIGSVFQIVGLFK